MRRGLSVLCAGLIWALFVVPAHAGPVLVPTLQTRQVTVRANNFTEVESDSRAASDFGTFEESLTVHPITIVDGRRYASQGNASQRSTLSGDVFRFSGSIYAQSIHPADSNATARSLFDVIFEVTEPATYSLAGSLRDINGTSAAGKLELTLANSGDVVFETGAGPDNINESGVLERASYRLILDAGSLGNSSAAGGGIDFDLTFAAEAAPAVSIPLPAGAWLGLSALGMLAAWAKR